MSFWLNQVNNALNKLDDVAEEARPDVHVVSSALASRARQLASSAALAVNNSHNRQNRNSTTSSSGTDDDEDDYENDDYDDDNDYYDDNDDPNNDGEEYDDDDDDDEDDIIAADIDNEEENNNDIGKNGENNNEVLVVMKDETGVDDYVDSNEGGGGEVAEINEKALQHNDSIGINATKIVAAAVEEEEVIDGGFVDVRGTITTSAASTEKTLLLTDDNKYGGSSEVFSSVDSDNVGTSSSSLQPVGVQTNDIVSLNKTDNHQVPQSITQQSAGNKSTLQKSPVSAPTPPASSATHSRTSTARIVDRSTAVSASSAKQLEQKYQHLKEATKEQKEINMKLKVSLSTAQSDVANLQNQNTILEQQLNAANKEMDAQMNELQQAATAMEQERAEAKLERQELMQEQDEEIQHIKNQYEQKLMEQKKMYEMKIQQIQQELTHEQETRHIETNENTVELETALQREKDALQKIIQLHTDKSSLESTVTKMEIQLNAIQKQLFSVQETAQTAVAAQQVVEEKYDTAVESYKHQLQQRQVREVELERTILELGTALQEQSATAVAAAKAVCAATNAIDSSAQLMQYKEQYEEAIEEVETLKTKLSLSESQYAAMQKEVQDISVERLAESATVQQQLFEYDKKIQSLTNTNNALESKIREIQRINAVEQDDPDNFNKYNNNYVGDSDGSPPKNATSDLGNTEGGESARTIRFLTHDIEQAKRKISSLSDQLLRQQGLSEQFKSEILALKGRLQAAIARAETAEQFNNNNNNSSDPTSFELLEMGDYSGQNNPTSGARQRRVKGGMGGGTKNRFQQLPGRSIRNAFGLRQTNTPGSIQQQIGKTVDVIDVWMLETGAILRHEPLARLGFGLYMVILHMWCFALVAFHTIEAEKHEIQHIPMRSGSLVSSKVMMQPGQ